MVFTSLRIPRRGRLCQLGPCVTSNPALPGPSRLPPRPCLHPSRCPACPVPARLAGVAAATLSPPWPAVQTDGSSIRHGPHWTSLPLHHGIVGLHGHTHPWMGGDPIALGDCALFSNLHTATRLDSL